MARKFFCGSCGHEVVHEVFEEGNCLSCRIELSRKLRSVSEGRKPVSYSKATQTDDRSDMHRFIRALLLRRPDAAIDKAVKENRWEDAYELEVKYHMEAAVSITSDARVRFATPAEARPPPCTNDEYVEDPFEPHICVTLHGPKRIINEWTEKPKPDPWSFWLKEPKEPWTGWTKGEPKERYYPPTKW